jgi:hypothetical protein
VKHGVAEEFAQEDILARVQSLTDKKRKLLNILVEKHDLKEPAEPRDSSSSSPLICMRSNGSKTWSTGCSVTTSGRRIDA